MWHSRCRVEIKSATLRGKIIDQWRLVEHTTCLVLGLEQGARGLVGVVPRDQHKQEYAYYASQDACIQSKCTGNDRYDRVAVQ